MPLRARKPSPRLRKALKQHTREAYHQAILDAAATVFGRMGFVEAKMADIAAEAGVSVGTLYNYFRSRDDVIGSLVAHQHAYFRESLSGVETIADPVARIRHILETSFRFLEERGALLAMAVQGGVLQRHVPTDHCGVDEDRSHGYVISLYESALSDAIGQKRIRADLSPARLALALEGMGSALIREWIRSGQSQPLAPQAEFVFDMFMKGADSS